MATSNHPPKTPRGGDLLTTLLHTEDRDLLLLHITGLVQYMQKRFPRLPQDYMTLLEDPAQSFDDLHLLLFMGLAMEQDTNGVLGYFEAHTAPEKRGVLHALVQYTRHHVYICQAGLDWRGQKVTDLDDVAYPTTQHLIWWLRFLYVCNFNPWGEFSVLSPPSPSDTPTLSINK